MPQLHELQGHWFLPGTFGYGEVLSTLPGAVLVGMLAPLVSYRRRDALTMLLFPPVGIRMAWIIGTRLGPAGYVHGNAEPIRGGVASR
jgi:hypothetical protein